MANARHIEWLLEGAEVWNARRERQDFTPDFEGADIRLNVARIGLRVMACYAVYKC